MTSRQENGFTGRTWVVVADSSHASIYLREQRNSPLRAVASLDVPPADAKAVAPAPDDTDPARRNGQAQFARQVINRVERGRTREEFKELILIAPPRLLGLMRESLTRPTLERVSREIPKNLVALAPERIRPYLNN